MIETSPLAWLLFGTLIAVATLAGRALSVRIPWSPEAIQARVPLAFAFAMGPFLAGLSMLAALLVLSGRPGWVQASATVAILIAVGLTAGTRTLARPEPDSRPSGRMELVWRILLGGWLLALVALTIQLPLTQNDALEYMIAARELYLDRSLSAYPPLSPETNASGFFGPWTHPPLYVALLDLMACLQGHFREPGIARLVAPWATIAAVLLTTAIGGMAGRLAGLISGTLLISTPILFFGAEGALSDSLPVLGMTMVLACAVGIAAAPVRVGLWTGVSMGACLYGHSSAVLCLPIGGVLLAIRYGRRHDFRSLVVCLGTAWTLALAIGCWPYVRNTVLFGTPISDLPAVFALPSLCWTDYFETGRGIGDWPGIIQYGWLKGWSAIESLGLAWWGMIFGALLASRLSPTAPEKVQAAPATGAPANRVLVAAIAGVLVFLAVVVATTSAGVNLLAKNERYFLLVQPLVAIVAGVLAARVLASRSNGRFWAAVGTGSSLVLAATLGGLLTFSLAYRLAQNGALDQGPGRPFGEVLDLRGEMLAMRHLREQVAPDALILSTKPADMFYADRRMLSYLDPRLLDFYRTTDPKEAAAILQTLGVTHIHAIDYGLPIFYHSCLQSITRDPHLTTLEFQADGIQVYSLSPESIGASNEIDLLATGHPWMRSERVLVGGRKAFLTGPDAFQPWNSAEESITELPWGLFNRDFSTSLTTGFPVPLQARPDAMVGIDVDLTGHGLVRLWVEQFNGTTAIRAPHGRSSFKVLLGDASLGACNDSVVLCRRFQISSAADGIQITIEHVGNSQVRIIRATLTHYD